MEIQFKLENFEGPLDLLIHLVEKNELNINEISISKIIDEYLLYIESAKEEKLSVKTEFLLMASELLEIKALSVLNKKEKEEKIEDLEFRIREYKKYKELSEQLSEYEKEYNISYTKDGEIFEKSESQEIDISSLTLQRIFDEYKKFFYEEKREEMKINVEPIFSVQEGIDEITQKLGSDKKLIFSSLLAKNYSRIKIVALFLAILELYRNGIIDIISEENIQIELVGWNKMENMFLFVYGRLREFYSKEKLEDVKSMITSKAETKGLLFDYNGDAVMIEDVDHTVYGNLIVASDMNLLLRHTDNFMGFNKRNICRRDNRAC